MPGITKESNEQNKKEVVQEKELTVLSNETEVDEATTLVNSDKQETVASKAVKEAKERIRNEVKEDLKQEKAKEGLKNDKTTSEVKKKILKEETVIEKIKKFISKIIEMQEQEDEVEEDSLERKNETKKEKAESNFKSKYMLEYYDLPYRYNETVVKILAQTPKRLFVYWDISDSDKKKFQEAFGDRFFEETYPVLLVHNEDKNYTFEVPINDFANSWYLDINDPKSKYVIQLGRKFRSRPEFINMASMQTNSVELQNDYVPITTSNVLEVPNDHILFEKIGTRALYRNIKTSEESYVDIANSKFKKKIGKIYSIYDLYKEIYKNELGDGSLTDLLNPSSMSSSGVNSSIYR